MTADAEKPTQALDQFRPELELVVESLSFQLQQTLAIAGLEILDVSPPAEIGDVRESLSYPIPEGFR